MFSSSSSVNIEISSTDITVEIIFVAFIWCRIDDSYNGDNDDDNNDDTYAHDDDNYDINDYDDDDDNDNSDYDDDDGNNDSDHDMLVIMHDS